MNNRLALAQDLKSLMEQSDIVPLLESMNFQFDSVDENLLPTAETRLECTNPPVVSLEGIEPPFIIEEELVSETTDNEIEKEEGE